MHRSTSRRASRFRISKKLKMVGTVRRSSSRVLWPIWLLSPTMAGTLTSIGGTPTRILSCMKSRKSRLWHSGPNLRIKTCFHYVRTTTNDWLRFTTISLSKNSRNKTMIMTWTQKLKLICEESISCYSAGPWSYTRNRIKLEQRRSYLN